MLQSTSRTLKMWLFVATICGSSFARSNEPKSPRELLDGSKRVLFLGDSITFAGGYVARIEAGLYKTMKDAKPFVVDVGLPSETVSGLSEEGHADGKFPRPCIHERLKRVLDLVKPDLVFTCYGMNCGIYKPLDGTRFQAYKDGYIKLKAEIEQTGAKCIVVTPVIYDDRKKPLGFSYGAVLDKYSEWLVSQRAQGWTVIDLHTEFAKIQHLKQLDDPAFTFLPDAVHPNEAGHEVIANVLMKALELTPPELPAATYKLVQQRMATLRDSYLQTAGHERPGMAKGLLLDEAHKQAMLLNEQILSQLK